MAETQEPAPYDVALEHAARVVGGIKEVIDPLLLAHEEGLHEEGVAAFIAALRDLPPLPLAAEARALHVTDGYVANLEIFPPNGSIEFDLHDIWRAATHGVGVLGGMR